MAKGKIKVIQIGSTNKANDSQKSTVKGLGLRRMHDSRVLEDTPAVRGMINKVPHLVKVEEVK